MKGHIQITFTGIEPEQQEWVIAHLAEAGYEGFEEEEKELKAFIPEKLFDQVYLKELAYKYQLVYKQDYIAAQNWNEVWESNFPPVQVNDFVYVRADFHPPVQNVRHEIIITPKMSFGTGHHATTFMMMEQMSAIDFRGKTVLDFGTGTGVLAIFAEKLGATDIIAIDNDYWSIENAKENLLRNNCSHINLVQAETAKLAQSFDIILANINKNVILENMATLADQVKTPGSVLFSGLLAADEEEIVQAGSEQMLNFIGKTTKANWLCLVCNR